MRQTSFDEWTGKLKSPFLIELQKALPLKENYRKVKIPKKGSGYRTIYVPSPKLKKVQRKILRYLRKLTIERWISIFGLYPRSSFMTHPGTHSNSRYIFQFDLKDAFPSVNIGELKQVVLGKILRGISYDQENTVRLANQLTNLIIELTTADKGLPQGFPTSPFLFYMILAEKYWFLQIKLHNELQKIYAGGWNISCYVDGFVISGNRPIPFEAQKRILNTFEQIGFRINPKKTRLQDCRNGAVMITGLMVDGNGNISVPEKTREKIRGLIHRACFIPFNPMLNQQIEGLITYLKSIYGEELPPRIVDPYNRYRIHRNYQKLAMISP